jgi:6-phosphogluconolactonase (cycloisomerase 2 family)
MKIGRWARLMLAVTPLLAGCGDFWQNPNGSGGGGGGGGCTTNCPTGSSGSFYVLNQYVSQIAAYSVVSGKLTAVTNSPFSLPSEPYAVAIYPGGGYVYVSTVVGIYMYTVDSTTGALTVGTGGAYPFLAYAMQVDPTGAWLVAAGRSSAESNSGEVVALPIDSSTGALGTAQTAAIAAPTVTQMAISADSANVFIALGVNGTEVIPFTSTASGTNPFASKAITIPLVSGGISALSVAVDPESTPRLFYIGETGAKSSSGGLVVYTYASLTGTLTQVTGSPYASGGLAPNAILTTSTGDYVYVANGTTGNTTPGNITGFSVTSTGSTYSLTTGSSIATGLEPVSLAEDSTGTYVFAVDLLGSPDLEAYTFDTTTPGKLDSAFTAATGTDPVQAVAIAAVQSSN